MLQVNFKKIIIILFFYLKILFIGTSLYFLKSLKMFVKITNLHKALFKNYI